VAHFNACSDISVHFKSNALEGQRYVGANSLEEEVAMPNSIEHKGVLDAIGNAQEAARSKSTKTVAVNGKPQTFRYPYPSPSDWRDSCIYFLMLDRFNNPRSLPKRDWNRVCEERQGGTFKGVQDRLGYLSDLGINAIWITSPLKNSRPDSWKCNYHGYAAQDFLNLDARFASDGTLETAEKELSELVEQAHARGIYVILDIVLNHSGRVFDYVRDGSTVDQFCDPAVINGALGSEPPIRWLNGLGFPRIDWEDKLTAQDQLGPDDAVFPTDLRNCLFFRRRGTKLNDTPDWRGFVPGDFGKMRQLVLEYDADADGQEDVRAKYGRFPVLDILIRSYAYLMARCDVDGFRIDTVKYVHPKIIEVFGNAMREYAMSIGKANFFTFGEVWDNENTIASFIGRNSGSSGEGFGVDAALDFPLFYILPGITKGSTDVRELQQVFQIRKDREQELLSSHGEASRYFVTFLDNHDQKERIKHPATPEDQVKLGLTLLFTLQGIPCIYYGTEQLLQGTVKNGGMPDLSCLESVREALWGKPDAFSTMTSIFHEIQHLTRLRQSEPALRYGRQYFREVSVNETDFGYSYGAGGIVAYSRILGDREILIAANAGEKEFNGRIIVDRDLNTPAANMELAHPAGKLSLPVNVGEAKINGSLAVIATVKVKLAPHEAQVWVTPARVRSAKPIREKVAA
jgi:glycosidase